MFIVLNSATCNIYDFRILAHTKIVMSIENKPAIEMKVKTTIEVSIQIPQNSSETWLKDVELWLHNNVPEVIEYLMDERFDEELIEAYNDNFEDPELEELSELGEIKMSIISHVEKPTQDSRK